MPAEGTRRPAIKRNSPFLVLLGLALAVTDARAQLAPVLRYAPPANTFRQALATPEDYSFNGFNASVQVYPFRPFRGNIQQLFETTLLRDWVSPLQQEENVAGPPNFRPTNASRLRTGRLPRCGSSGTASSSRGV